ncbi:MAG: sugar transferase [Anaerolineales bacterium]|nr:sugar transferase [Anaerolineales bacterium]
MAFWLSHLIRSNWELEILGGSPEIFPFESYSWMMFVVFPLAAFFLDIRGFYDRPWLSSRRLVIWHLSTSCILTTISLVIISFLVRNQPARSVIILFGAISFLLVFIKEELHRLWIQSQWARGKSTRHFILVGAKDDNAEFLQQLKTRHPQGIVISAELDINNTPIEQLADLLHQHSANGVILNAKHTYFGQIEVAIQICELEGVEVWLLADFFKTQLSKTILDDFIDRPTLVFRSTPEESWQALAKHIIDFLGAFFFLICFSWLFLLIAILIKATSTGPVLFRQRRSGLNGKPFIMLKFRSMISDAEQRQHELASINEMTGPVFKVTNDPRITPLGRWLRRYSLDELPQLWNVLRGEMSLVGPRPLPVDEVLRFNDLSHRRRLSVKPGLTCLWQICGRNDVKDFSDWVRLDLEYIDNWSLWLDLKILLRTIPIVLTGAGAK